MMILVKIVYNIKYNFLIISPRHGIKERIKLIQIYVIDF